MSEDLLPRHGVSTVQTQLRESANCKVGCRQSAFCWSIAADFWRVRNECSKINFWKLTLMHRGEKKIKEDFLNIKHPTHKWFLHAEHSRLNFSTTGNLTSFLVINELIVQFLRQRHGACLCYLIKMCHPQVLLWPWIAHFSVPTESHFVQSTRRIPPFGHVGVFVTSLLDVDATELSPWTTHNVHSRGLGPASLNGKENHCLSTV